MNRLVLVSLVASTACTGLKLSTARQTVSNQTQCPANKINVWETGQGWYADGCGARYLCQVPEGPCAESLTDAQQLTRARAAFSRETGCLLGDVSVTPSNRGIVAQGCGRYSVCVSYDGPCVPSRPPTCSEVAQERYDACLDVARKDGKGGEVWGYGMYGVGAVVANQFIASERGRRMMDECRHQFDTATTQCR
jgi:hypothetical protein